MSKAVCDFTLETLLGDSLTSSLCVNVERNTPTWVATGMLVQQLESFTDSVVVRENNKPIGIVGGKDIIIRLAKEPNSSLFYNTAVEDIMEKNFPLISKDSTLRELVNFWQKSGRAFATITNEFADYSALSAKKMLEIAKKCITDLAIVDLPQKKLRTFSIDNTIGDVIYSMLDNNIRRLMLENSSKFINDRIILQKITDDLKCLKEIENFLDLPVSDFSLEHAKEIPSETKIPELATIMLQMEHPCVISDSKIITPWDICLVLLSEKITEIKTSL